jgi:hypothetical protein
MGLEEKYKDFTVKRMFIFNELVKGIGRELSTAEDLEELAVFIRDKYGFRDDEMPFIKNHIRIAMGLDPRGEEGFSDELEWLKQSGRVDLPVIAKIDGPCEYCDKKDCIMSQNMNPDCTAGQRKLVIEDNKCLNCGECVTSCDFGALADKIEFLPVVNLLKEAKDSCICCSCSGHNRTVWPKCYHGSASYCI